MCPMLVIPSSSPSGVLKYEYVQPNGTIRDFSGFTNPRAFVAAGSIGWGTPEFEIADLKRPFSPGTAIQHINTKSRILQVPIFLREETIGDLILAVETLHDIFFTGDENNQTPGAWRITRPDDSIRQLQCYYRRGLEGDLNEGSPTHVKYVLEFLAPDPYPTDPSPTVRTRTVAEAASFAVFNQGKIDAYPIWKVTGPFNTIALTNHTTNQDMVLALAMSVGHYLIIDTRPSEIRDNAFSIYDDLGANKISTIFSAPTSKFWHLAPGVNNITVTFGASTNAYTTIELTYTGRYRSGLR